MAYPKFIVSASVVVALTLVASPSAFAQRGHGRAVPRGSVRAVRPPVVVAPFRSYAYRTYVPRVNFSFFYGRPGYFGSYAYGNPFYAYGYPAYGYPAYDYPAYGYP